MSRKHPFLIVVVLWSTVLTAPQAVAAPTVNVGVSSADYLELPRAAPNIFIADPTIADLQVPSSSGKSVIVFGKKPGTTTLIALDADGKAVFQAEVRVFYDRTALEHLIRQEVPGGSVSLSDTPGGFVLGGIVPDAETAEKIRALAARYIDEKQEIINQLKVIGPQQVNLRVRVAEVTRQVTKELGFNWQAAVSPGAFTFGLATGRNAILFPGEAGNPFGASGYDITQAPALAAGTAAPGSLFSTLHTGRANVNSVIDALAEEGLVTVLAEPNLTALSGQTASFLAGGEFPIPVAQNNSSGAASITIDYKQYGVSLQFVPTVLSSDHISLRVRPEVSELTDQGAVKLTDITIPALSVRRADTTVELGSGESFAIAGLIQNNVSSDLNKYPGLGDLPILGPLFRSTSFQRKESELVIIVTPYVVRPVDSHDLRSPADSLAPASDIERIFLQRLNQARGGGGMMNEIGVTGLRLEGDAGFMED